MKNILNRKRNFSQSTLDILYLNENLEDRLISKLLKNLKENKSKLCNLKIRNKININNDTTYHKSKTLNNKCVIKKNLESCINLSKEYNNFCGNFLFPDYQYAAGKKILKELKSNGPDKTVQKHFSHKIQKSNCVKSAKSISRSRNQFRIIKSKYMSLINCNTNNKLTRAPIKKKYNAPSNNKVYNNIKHKIIYYEMNGKEKSLDKKNYIFKIYNNRNLRNKNIINNSTINKSRSSFIRDSISNSKSYISNSTTCFSKSLKDIKRF